MLKVKLDKDTVAYIKSKVALISKKTVGVYLLKFNGVVVYVGKSNNIPTRILSHTSEQIKLFNDFSFIECSVNTLDSTEVAYIRMYDPVFNMQDSLTKGDSLEEFCYKNNLDSALYEHNTSVVRINVSIEEDILKKADEIVKGSVDVKTRSHLLETLILKEYAKFVKKDKNVIS